MQYKLSEENPLLKILQKLDKGITECKELISIFVRSIETARKITCPRENGDRQKTLKHFSFLVICYLLKLSYSIC